MLHFRARPGDNRCPFFLQSEHDERRETLIMDLDSNSSGKDIEEETNVCISPCCQNRCPKDKRAPLLILYDKLEFRFRII